MIPILSQFIIGSLLIIISLFSNTGVKENILASGIVIIISTILGNIIIPFIADIKNIIDNILLIYLRISNKKIRFSMSYLYVIKIDDKYLLVKNSNYDSFQHVGGKYKSNPEAKKVFEEMQISEDPYQKICKNNINDLAVYVPAKNAKRFISWFKSQKNREVSHWREFNEELMLGKKGGIVLDRELFPYINYRYLGNVQTPIKRSSPDSGWHCWEKLFYDILEPIFSEEQENAMRLIKEKGNNAYVKWASASIIDNQGYNSEIGLKEYSIGIHTKWAKNLKWSKE